MIKLYKDNDMRMYIRHILCSLFFACIAPVAAFGVMAYTPTFPCGCVTGCDMSQCCGPQKQDYEFAQEEVDNDWYWSVFLADNMWSWENKYNSDYGGVNLSFASDKYSFESVIGGAVAVGTTFGSDVRADLELGLMSNFSDSDENFKISMSLPYLMVNLYHDFEEGFYIGAGLGMARATAELSGDIFENKGARKSLLSPKFGGMIGYTTSIADGTYIDFRYRLSGVKGTAVSNSRFLWDEYSGEYEEFYLQVTGGWILENAIMAGLRFNF